jgi:WD40 repeat protein
MVAVFGVDGQPQMEWKALHSGAVDDVDWVHSARCASASWDNTCKVWHPRTGELAKATADRGFGFMECELKERVGKLSFS